MLVTPKKALKSSTIGRGVSEMPRALGGRAVPRSAHKGRHIALPANTSLPEDPLLATRPVRPARLNRGQLLLLELVRQEEQEARWQAAEERMEQARQQGNRQALWQWWSANKHLAYGELLAISP